jgi:molybdopterin synthase sulfur carrier subunit
MKIQVRFFGQLEELTGKVKIETGHISDTDTLVKRILELYPSLKEFRFLVTVDRKVVGGNQPLTPGSEVAFLPPFSGG